MKIKAISIFPLLYEPFMQVGVMKMAIDKGILDFEAVNLRDYTHDRHHTTDDIPFGGGAGMMFLPKPLIEAMETIDNPAGSWLKIGVAPQGDRLTQRMVEDLAHEERLLFVAGRYEGIDERVMERLDLTISIGDIVLSGGEIAAIEIIDAITRLLPGATGNAASTGEESFSRGSCLGASRQYRKVAPRGSAQTNPYPPARPVRRFRLDRPGPQVSQQGAGRPAGDP